jgi:hypothetical protein
MNKPRQKIEPDSTIEPIAGLMNEVQAARYLATTSNTLRLSRHTGQLWLDVPAPKFVRAGRAVRYVKADLDEWIARLSRYGSIRECRESTTGPRIRK